MGGFFGDVFGGIADAFGLGGTSGTKTNYEMSPEQKWMYQQMQPIFRQAIAQAGSGQGLYNVPSMPSAPALTSPLGILSGLQPYQVAGYDVQGYQSPTMTAPSPWLAPTYGIPATESMMPTYDWFSNISPEIMAGIRAPYDEGMKQLEEQLGAAGQGSARGGYSGAAGAAMGRYQEEAAKDIGLSAWSMLSPALQAAYQAEIARGAQQAAAQQQALATGYGGQLTAGQTNAQLAAQQLAQTQSLQAQAAAQQAAAQTQANQAQYQAGITERSLGLQNLWQQQMADYQAALMAQQQQLQANQFPWAMLPSLMSGMPASQGITTQPQNFWQSYLAPMVGPAAILGGMALGKPPTR